MLYDKAICNATAIRKHCHHKNHVNCTNNFEEVCEELFFHNGEVCEELFFATQKIIIDFKTQTM